MTNSRAKGAAGERELSNVLKSFGYNTRRGQQYCGANGDADVIGLNGVHIECKRVEKFELYKSLKQSQHDAKENEMPVVMHRKNKEKWVVVQPLEEWMELYNAYQSANRQ